MSAATLCRIGRLIPEGQRRLHRAFAETFGFFWLPCPSCRECFGGHEWRDIDGKSSTIDPEKKVPTWTGTGICPACTRAGRGEPLRLR